jgi:PBSX family phage terminase large subunit
MEIKLSEWQTIVWDDPARYKVINIGRRGGKTTIGAVKLTQFAIEHSKSISWYIAPTYRQAKQILWEMLKEIIPKQAIEKKNETELCFELKNGSKIYLKGADNPDSLRGVRIDFCIFDEVAFFERWEEVWKVIRPTLADSSADVWFISTPNGFNHFKELAEMNEEGWSYHHYTTYDNPFMPVTEIDAMKREMDEDSFAQEVLGEFRKMSGLIYKTFNRQVHMVDVPDIRGYNIYRALDFGFAHKTALGYFAVNSIGTEMYVFDGLYEVGMTTSEIADAVKLKDSGKHILNAVADSAQPMQIEELSRYGVHFTPIEKGADSVKSGIAKVAELLKLRADTGKPTLMFSKHLTWIADEFEKYRWMEQKTGLNTGIKEVPLKRDDDAMDMIRYFAMNYKKDNKDSTLSVVRLNQQSRNKWSIK